MVSKPVSARSPQFLQWLPVIAFVFTMLGSAFYFGGRDVRLDEAIRRSEESEKRVIELEHEVRDYATRITKLETRSEIQNPERMKR